MWDPLLAGILLAAAATRNGAGPPPSILRSSRQIAEFDERKQRKQHDDEDGLIYSIRHENMDSKSILQRIEEAQTKRDHFSNRLYTVALERLSGDKNACTQLLQPFVNNDQHHPISSYMAVALIQSYCTEDPNDIQKLQLEQYYPRPWHAAVRAAAIRACAIKTRVNVTEAERLFVEQNNEEKVLLALLAVYRTARMVQRAVQLVKAQSGIVSNKVWNALLQVCVESKDVETAKRIMEESIETPNVYQATTFLNCLLASRRRDEACQYLLERMTTVGPPPDSYAVWTVMKACHDDFPIVLRILQAIKDGTLTVPLVEDHYNCVLSACDDSIMAKELIQEMRFSRRHRQGAVPPSQISYTKALVACRKAADLTTARSLLTIALNDGVIPDVFMYTTAIWTAARARNSRMALAFLEQMTQHKVQPTIVSYNGALAACASRGQATKAHDLLVRLLEQKCVPTGLTYSHFIAALGQEDPSVRQMTMGSILAYLDDDALRSRSTVTLLREFVRTCGLTDDFNRAKTIMTQLGEDADDSIVLAFAKICSESSKPRWNETVALINTKSETMSKPALSRLYSHAIVAYARQGLWVEAMELMDICFSDEGFNPSASAVNALISACGRNDRPDVALSVFYAAGDNHVTLTERTYRSAIMACSRAEHKKSEAHQEDVGEWWECALSLLRRMIEQGLTPDPAALSSTISACEAAGQWKAALRTLQSAMEQGLDCNMYCFNAAIAACQKGGAWVEALDIYERLKEDDRLKPNMVTIGSLIEALDGAGQQQLATSMYTEGIRNRYLTSPLKVTTDSSSETEILTMDLHSFSAALAKAALRSYFESLLEDASQHRPVSKIRPFVVIVGKGQSRTDVEPVLKSVVAEFLSNEYGIVSMTDSKNQGRLVVSKADLEEYASKGLS